MIRARVAFARAWRGDACPLTAAMIRTLLK
jgi:hypothetical protein